MHTGAVLSLRISVPGSLTDDVLTLLESDDYVTGLAVHRGASRIPPASSKRTPHKCSEASHSAAAILESRALGGILAGAGGRKNITSVTTR